VEELAERCGVTVDTVRFYQTKGLLPRPEREGRLAWYDDAHVGRLERIRELKDSGFTLAMIARVLAGDLDAGEEALALALTGPLPDEALAGAGADRFTLEQLAEHAGVSATLLEALEREGLLVGQPDSDGQRHYGTADAGAVAAGMALLEAGVPLSELLDLARRHDAAMQATAANAVDLFARFVRDPIRAAAGDEAEAAGRMVEALYRMLPATTTLVAHHFRGRLLDAARARLEADASGDPGGEDAGR
jgi:DNA-binding transcriptional MerR regulator